MRFGMNPMIWFTTFQKVLPIFMEAPPLVDGAAWRSRHGRGPFGGSSFPHARADLTAALPPDVPCGGVVGHSEGAVRRHRQSRAGVLERRDVTSGSPLPPRPRILDY